MLYDEFRERISEAVGERCVNGAHAEFTEVDRSNGEKREAMGIFFPDERAVPLLYLDMLYVLYGKGYSLEEIADGVIRAAEKGSGFTESDLELADWERVRDRIGIKVIEGDKNREILRKAPHYRVLDLALIYYIYFEREGNPAGFSVITKDNLAMWEIPAEELHRQALENTKSRFAAEALPMERMLGQLLGAGRPVEEAGTLVCEVSSSADSPVPVYVVTNRNRYLGASAALMPGILKRILGKLEWDSCYMIPSSVHEMLLIPEYVTASERIREMVREVNDGLVAPEDRLSYSVYEYDLGRDALRLADGEQNWHSLQEEPEARPAVGNRT